MKQWKIPVSWEVCGVITVEAETLEEAIEYFDANSDTIDLPIEHDYIDGSFNRSETEVCELENKVS